MVKKCVRCGMEEPVDYFSEIEEKSFVCDNCMHKVQEPKLETESNLENLSTIKSYSAENSYNGNQNKKKSGIYKVMAIVLAIISISGGIIKVYIKLQHVIPSETESSMNEESELELNYDDIIINTEAYDIHKIFSVKDDSDLNSYFNLVTNNDGVISYMSLDHSAKFKMEEVTGKIIKFEMLKNTDTLTYGKASLNGKYSDLKTELLDSGAVYNKEEGYFEVEEENGTYIITVTADINGKISEFSIESIS